MRHLGSSLAITLLVAGLLASAAAAASSAVDAKRLALRQADLPPTARRMSERENRAARLPGGNGQIYTTTFQYRAGRRTKAVGTIVITAPSLAVARRVYSAAVGDATKVAAAKLGLPALGDQQDAAPVGRPALDEASAIVWVRRRTVVWQIQVSSVENPFGFSRKEARSELTTYALKQKRRVGGG